MSIHLLAMGAMASVPVATETAVSYGALTLAGAGGIALPAGATSITDADGTNLVVDSGNVVPDTGGGVTSGTVTFNNGATWEVTAVADTYSAGTKAEMEAAVTAAGATTGKTVSMLPGTYAADHSGGTGQFFHNRNPSNVVTITCDDMATTTFNGLWLSSCSNLTMDGLSVREGAAGNFATVYDDSTNITFQNNEIFGPSEIDPEGDYSAVAPTVTGTGVLIHSYGTMTDISVLNNHIKWTYKGITGGVDAGDCILRGNYLHDIYADFFELSYAGADSTIVSDNVMIGMIAVSTDTGNPHPDYIQTSASGTTENWTGLQIERNIILNIYDRAGPQALFISNMNSGYFYEGASIKGNLIMTNGAGGGNGISIPDAMDCEVIGNTIVSNGDFADTSAAAIQVGTSTSAGTNIVRNNAADSYSIAAALIAENNITLGANGATISYSTAFDGPTFTPSTRAEALTAFAMKASGPLDLTTEVGAVGSGYVTFPSASPGYSGAALDTDYEITIPSRFETGDWSVATGSSESEIDVTITALPAANGAAISDVEYDVDESDSWSSLPSYSGTGSYTLTMAAGATSYDIRLRAVNSTGDGVESATKAATSGAAAADPLTLLSVYQVENATSDGAHRTSTAYYMFNDAGSVHDGTNSDPGGTGPAEGDQFLIAIWQADTAGGTTNSIYEDGTVDVNDSGGSSLADESTILVSGSQAETTSGGIEGETFFCTYVQGAGNAANQIVLFSQAFANARQIAVWKVSGDYDITGVLTDTDAANAAGSLSTSIDISSPSGTWQTAAAAMWNDNTSAFEPALTGVSEVAAMESSGTLSAGFSMGYHIKGGSGTASTTASVSSTNATNLSVVAIPPA